MVSTQVDRLKTVRKSRNIAHFEAMLDAKICCLRRAQSNRFSAKVRQLCFF
jgi:hypothetical protein